MHTYIYICESNIHKINTRTSVKLDWQSFEVTRVAIGKIPIAPFTWLNFHRTFPFTSHYLVSYVALEIAFRIYLYTYIYIYVCICIYRGPRGENWGQKLMQPQRARSSKRQVIQLDLSTRSLRLFTPPQALTLSFKLSSFLYQQTRHSSYACVTWLFQPYLFKLFFFFFY